MVFTYFTLFWGISTWKSNDRVVLGPFWISWYSDTERQNLLRKLEYGGLFWPKVIIIFDYQIWRIKLSSSPLPLFQCWHTHEVAHVKAINGESTLKKGRWSNMKQLFVIFGQKYECFLNSFVAQCLNWPPIEFLHFLIRINLFYM